MKIGVACGGVSPEREVSLRSGAAVGKALTDAGNEVSVIDITHPADFLTEARAKSYDAIFIALHGGWGEDGRFQSALESFGLPYTGPGPLACALAMDKEKAKVVMSAAGVRVPRGITVERGRHRDEACAEMLKRHGKVVVKPNSGGSTVCVTIASEIEQVKRGIEEAWRKDDRVLVEEYIPGYEATVAVMEEDDGRSVALPPVHINPKEGFYDYKNKYTSGSTEYICPADFSEEVTAKLSEMAIAAHDSLGCRVYSRADFRITEEGEVCALEVNTAPGMTALSLVPKAAAAYGLDFPDFLERVVRLSLAVDRNFPLK
jgi:D-alanine-D-alanine ligase